MLMAERDLGRLESGGGRFEVLVGGDPLSQRLALLLGHRQDHLVRIDDTSCLARSAVSGENWAADLPFRVRPEGLLAVLGSRATCAPSPTVTEARRAEDARGSGERPATNTLRRSSGLINADVR
jgi:hypothetical protein